MERGLLIVVAVLAVVIAGLYFTGPRVEVDTTVTFDPADVADDPETYLATSEARFTDIRPGLAKEIVWADPDGRTKTPLSIVYIHGFSASKGEVRPLPDQVAAAMGANLFYTRLTGHGRDGPAMATASVNAWINDVAEALTIGRAIGERVIVIATSTGGSLAAWAATQPALSEKVAGMVLISPNFGVQATGAGLLTGPWGRQIAELVIGSERGFEPANELQAALWTTRYPTSATLPMAAAVELARGADLDRAPMPALFVLSENDQVVRPIRSKVAARDWAAPNKVIVVNDSGDPSSHVLAGDALSPATTDRLANEIIEWIEALPAGDRD